MEAMEAGETTARSTARIDKPRPATSLFRCFCLVFVVVVQHVVVWSCASDENHGASSSYWGS
jgi:hypothetical protein